MVDPYIPRAKDRYPITIRLPPMADMRGARPDIRIPGWLAIIHMHIVYNHIAHILQSDASVSGYLHVGPTPVDSLVAINYELMFKLDDHVRLEDDPKGLVLDDGMAEGSRCRAHGVLIRGVGNDIVTPPFAPQCRLAKAYGALGQALAVVAPVRVAAPTVVDGVSSEALGLRFRPEELPVLRYRLVHSPVNDVETMCE